MASVWEQYKALPPRTRIYLGLGVMAFSMAGLYVSDMMEEKLDPARKSPDNTNAPAKSSTTVPQDS